MTDSHPQPTDHTPTITTLLWRVAWPFFLFSAVLASLLLLSWTLLLPRYSRVDVNGVTRTAEELLRYKTTLLGQIAQSEDDRRTLALPIHDDAYQALKDLRESRASLEEWQDSLKKEATRVMAREDALAIEKIAYDPQEKTVELTGDLRNLGTSSMTMLAAYVSALKALPNVTGVTTPAFTREDDPTIGLHSPFTLTLTLQ